MNSKLSIQDIADLLVANNQISKEEADKFVVELFSLIEKGLSTDELTKVKDLGTFKLTPIQERESVDVNTQEKIVIPAHRRVSFVPAQTLKSLVNKPFAHFETTPLNDGIFIDGINQDALSCNEENDNDDRDDEDKVVESELTKENDTDKVATDAFNTDEMGASEYGSEVVQEELPNPAATSILSTDKNKEKELSVQPSSSAPFIESKMEEPSASAGSSTKEEEKKGDKIKSAIGISNKPKSKKPKSRGKLRRYILRWDIAIGLFMILGVSFAYNYYFTTNNPCEKGVEESEIPKPIIGATPLLTETPSDEVVDAVDSLEILKLAEMGPRETVKMSAGTTLRLIALEKLGNREFWVYIYLQNKDKIKNPDVVPIGLELELPNQNEYKMDANDSDDIFKAKKLGEQVMKSFW